MPYASRAYVTCDADLPGITIHCEHVQPDVVLIHPPSVFDFRERPIVYGPISDVIPSTPVFEMYPVGFLTLAAFLRRNGYSKVVEFSGSLTPRERSQVLSTFVDGDPLILLTTDAASEGLNLQHNCRRVISPMVPQRGHDMTATNGFCACPSLA